MTATLAAAAVVAQAGCASMVSRATGRVAENLTAAIMNQPDPETVRQGAPAFLLLIDGLIEGEPESVALLGAGARLYSAYAAAFVDDGSRAGLLAARARSYGLRALCCASPATCAAELRPFEDFEAALRRVSLDAVPALYAAGAAWAGWIQVNSGDFKAIAEKARVEAIMKRVVALDEGFDGGGAHLYLGVLDTLLPPALGGHPESGREHFERAVAMSGGRNLMVKTLYAKHYARLVFDRELHDRLCREVLDAEPEAPGLTLVNVLAQQQAKALLAQSDEYFLE